MDGVDDDNTTYASATADLSLISSDNVTIRLDSFMLKAVR
jgi:hypothetical protein